MQTNKPACRNHIAEKKKSLETNGHGDALTVVKANAIDIHVEIDSNLGQSDRVEEARPPMFDSHRGGR